MGRIEPNLSGLDCRSIYRDIMASFGVIGLQRVKCRHYPGAAAGRRLRSSHPAVTAFPENVVGSACTSSFSRLAQRLLALRPAHSRRHQYVTCYTEGFSHFVTSMTAPVASGWSGCRVGLAPTGKRRLSRRTRCAVIEVANVDVAVGKVVLALPFQTAALRG